MNKILAPFAFISRPFVRAARPFTRPLAAALTSDVYKEGAQLRHTIADMGREVVRQWRPDEIRSETFEHAVNRRGLTNEDLATLYKQSASMALVLSFFAAAALGWFLACLTNGDVTALAAFGAFAFTGAYAFNRSFRACQIERREMFTLGQFARQPGAWVPSFNLEAIRAGVSHV